MDITGREYKKLQEKYNRPRDYKQQKKYEEYEKKIREIRRKPPNDKQHYLEVGINELKGNCVMDSKGYYYDPLEKKWCLYCLRTDERSDKMSFYLYEKKETEEEAFQYLYEMFEENVKRYEWELERDKNDRMTKKEFLEWFGQDNRESRLAEKGPYQILWNREPKKEKYAVGYYYEITSDYIRANFGDSWVAYVIVNGKKMSCSYKHETRAIFLMRCWIEMIIAGDFDDN